MPVAKIRTREENRQREKEERAGRKHITGNELFETKI